MKGPKTLLHANQAGSVSLVSLIFVVVFSALAVAMAAMSGTNVQMAKNQHNRDSASACAESGLEVLRYWLGGVAFTGVTAPGQRFEVLAGTVQNNLTVAGISNVVPVLSGSTITISEVPIQSESGRCFSAVLTKVSDDLVQLDVTGHYRGVNRTLRSQHVFTTRADNVFDYGLASKGPMHLYGNLDVSSFNGLQVESNAFIVSPSSAVALTMEGKAAIGGSVTLTDATKLVDLQGGNVTIGGEKGAAALSHVGYNDGTVEFPEMHPELFYSYATNVVTPTTNLSGVTLDNIRIPAGLNPTFSGGTTLRGVIYIETPNVVTFGGGTTITGIVVTNGSSTYDPPPDSPTSPRIILGSNVNSFSVSQLPPEPQFAGLQSQTGTFILAPGFIVEMTGTFGVLNGAIGANGIVTSGNTSGTVRGSIINYSNNTMQLTGNGDLMFNRTGLAEVPAGFVPQTILRYDPSTYSEVFGS